mgnify:CR=1 FL=1
MNHKHDYFWFKNILSKDQLIELHMLTHLHYDKEWKDHPAQARDNKPLKNITDLKPVGWKHIKHLLHRAYENIKVINIQNFGFHIYDLTDLDLCLHNTYGETNKGAYDWHYDGSNDFSHTYRFTVLINTSLEKYEGGDFNLFVVGGAIKIPELEVPGNMIIFRSEMLHRVTPVIKGTRNTLSFFLKGPKYV